MKKRKLLWLWIPIVVILIVLFGSVASFLIAEICNLISDVFIAARKFFKAVGDILDSIGLNFINSPGAISAFKAVIYG